ncbi:MAG: hypothetical protein GY854_01460 [Deltaproteobacteria bacterium]|nr:hypothetical protein [Deltaproteobacteria bacterium]
MRNLTLGLLLSLTLALPSPGVDPDLVLDRLGIFEAEEPPAPQMGPVLEPGGLADPPLPKAPEPSVNMGPGLGPNG